MRLQNPSSKQKGLSGPNADIVDQLLTNKKKRSRPISSSLEFHTSDKTRVTTMKSPSTKNKSRSKNQQPPPPQPITATRARGSGGIPKAKLQLQDLEGMAEEEILQALYEDPDLAAAAAAAASESNRSQQKDAPPKTTRRQQVSKYPTHAKEMMEQGIPYKQWIIILLLLGVAAYQIFKSLKPPQTSKKRGGGKGIGVSKKTRSAGEKSKKKKVELKAAAKTPDGPIAINSSGPSQDAHIRGKTSTAKKKVAKVAVVKADKPGEKSATRPQQPESPDSVSTDGSTSSTNDVVPALSKETKENKASQKPASTADSGSQKKNGRVEENTEGWQEVGGIRVRPYGKQTLQEVTSAPKGNSNGVSNGREPLEKTEANSSDSPGTIVAVAVHVVNIGNEKAAGEIRELNVSSSTTVANAAGEKVKRARKKKAKATPAVAPLVSSTLTVEDDASIALKLQKEEEKLAEASEWVEPEPEVWKEVTTKKRKGTLAEEVANTDPVAVDESI